MPTHVSAIKHDLELHYHVDNVGVQLCKNVSEVIISSTKIIETITNKRRLRLNEGDVKYIYILL